jgi:mannose-6-phosphate isomerase-like protein (cupin superfamily)
LVAGAGPDGRSRVLVDETAGNVAALGTLELVNLWRGALGPVDNAAPLEEGLAPFRIEQLAEPAYGFVYVEYAPGHGKDDPGMHFTNTADHMVVLEGEVVLVLEEGEVALGAGDVCICRGAVHGWRNDSGAPARLVAVAMPADPLPGRE